MDHNRNTKALRFDLISKYRAVLMGTAIILIMFCHLDTAQIHNGVNGTHLASFFHSFTVGVDLFLFLSGLGLYYSYSKRKESYAVFEKRRIMRILPYYVVFAGVTYVVYDILIQKQTVGKLIKDFFFISWFQSGNTRYWYILAILIFYLVFPVIFRCVSKKHALFFTLAVCVAWWIVVETLSLNSEYVLRFRIALSRLPVFILGTYCGRLSKEQIEMPKPLLIITLPFGYLSLILLLKCVPHPLFEYLYYPVRCFLAISIMETVVLVMEYLEKKSTGLYQTLLSILTWFGGLTLEMYLLHQSYMILFEYPYQPAYYFLFAFALPTATAALIFWLRTKRKRGTVS